MQREPIDIYKWNVQVTTIEQFKEVEGFCRISWPNLVFDIESLPKPAYINFDALYYGLNCFCFNPYLDSRIDTRYTITWEQFLTIKPKGLEILASFLPENNGSAAKSMNEAIEKIKHRQWQTKTPTEAIAALCVGDADGEHFNGEKYFTATYYPNTPGIDPGWVCGKQQYPCEVTKYIPLKNLI
ncbi:MAG: hypothetical protein V4538_01675 [Bacteroidota bacterium]